MAVSDEHVFYKLIEQSFGTPSDAWRCADAVPWLSST